jgi:pimeloyl-ACP methyl ester carboxylesterase
MSSFVARASWTCGPIIGDAAAQIRVRASISVRTSGGSRVSYVTALRYPEVVRGMYLWLASGGPVAERLGEGYYGQHAKPRCPAVRWRWPLTPSGQSAPQRSR